MKGGCASALQYVENHHQQQQQQQLRTRKKTGAGEEDNLIDPAKGNDRTTAVVEGVTTTKTQAMSKSDKRGSVIRGMVAALVPWEHSRQTQRAALLVLGNVLDNCLDEGPDAPSEGVKDGKYADRSASESCAEDLDKALVTSATGGQGEWANEEEQEQEEEVVGVDR